MAEDDRERKVLLCSECFTDIGEGSCGENPDDPPIDPARPEVRDMLADKDHEALTRLQRKLMGIAAIPGVLVLFGMVVLDAASNFALPRALTFGVAMIVILVGTMLGRERANRRFKPRYARWTGLDYEMGEDIEELLERSRGSEDPP